MYWKNFPITIPLLSRRDDSEAFLFLDCIAKPHDEVDDTSTILYNLKWSTYDTRPVEFVAIWMGLEPGSSNYRA